MDNFKTGDCYLTCTYREKPDTVEQIKKDWAKFKRKLKNIYQKMGQEYKFIGILENLFGGGRPHGHILIPEMVTEAIRKIKKIWPHGNVEMKTYGGEPIDAHRLAKYFTKDSVFKNASAIQSSRNLIRSETKKEMVIRSETYMDSMKAPAGYHIVKELSYQGYTEEGYPMTKIFLERDMDDDRKLPSAYKILRKPKPRKIVGTPGGRMQ
ncbi:MAG: hypothetical protein K6C05_07295 [Anaerovibrio sp.]|uniref:rolling circle replication-associated protein n=1 Tax=Anaerovibrio sp. TaxID=1872532 RepID=UPI0025DBB006|nr:hypothetical protein [Anaerovibrio sp.]MCR5176643.1 hypothetical protein [Anaerovibrio sp.]